MNNTTWTGTLSPISSAVNIVISEPDPKLQKANQVIKAYQDYVEFLKQVDARRAGLAYAHPWMGDTPEDCIKGQEHRNIIQASLDDYKKS